MATPTIVRFIGAVLALAAVAIVIYRRRRAP